MPHVVPIVGHTKDQHRGNKHSGNRPAALQEVANTDQGVPLCPRVAPAALVEARARSATDRRTVGQRSRIDARPRTLTPHDVAILRLHSRRDELTPVPPKQSPAVHTNLPNSSSNKRIDNSNNINNSNNSKKLRQATCTAWLPKSKPSRRPTRPSGCKLRPSSRQTTPPRRKSTNSRTTTRPS